MRTQLQKISKRGLLISAAMLSSFLLTIAGFTGSASAISCPVYTNIICLYKDANYSGDYAFRYDPVPGVCYGFTSSFNDVVSSLFNGTPGTLILYINAGCSNWDAQLWINQGVPVSNLSGSGFNDAVSSYKWQY